MKIDFGDFVILGLFGHSRAPRKRQKIVLFLMDGEQPCIAKLPLNFPKKHHPSILTRCLILARSTKLAHPIPVQFSS